MNDLIFEDIDKIINSTKTSEEAYNIFIEKNINLTKILCYSVMKNYYELATFLIERDVNPDTYVDNLGHKPFKSNVYYAAVNNNVELLKLIISKIPASSRCEIDSYNIKFDVIKILIENGFKIRLNNMYLFMSLINENNIDAIKFCLNIIDDGTPSGTIDYRVLRYCIQISNSYKNNLEEIVKLILPHIMIFDMQSLYECHVVKNKKLYDMISDHIFDRKNIIQLVYNLYDD